MRTNLMPKIDRTEILSQVKLIAISKGQYTHSNYWYDPSYVSFEQTSTNYDQTYTFLVPCSGYIAARDYNYATLGGTVKLNRLTTWHYSWTDDVYEFKAEVGDTLTYKEISNGCGYEIFVADTGCLVKKGTFIAPAGSVTTVNVGFKPSELYIMQNNGTAWPRLAGYNKIISETAFAWNSAYELRELGIPSNNPTIGFSLDLTSTGFQFKPSTNGTYNDLTLYYTAIS